MSMSIVVGNTPQSVCSFASEIFEIITNSIIEEYSFSGEGYLNDGVYDDLNSIFKYNINQQYQGFISLDNLNKHNFNIFYQHTKNARNKFRRSVVAMACEREWIPWIIECYDELLEMMRIDSRYYCCSD